MCYGNTLQHCVQYMYIAVHCILFSNALAQYYPTQLHFSAPQNIYVNVNALWCTALPKRCAGLFFIAMKLMGCLKEMHEREAFKVYLKVKIIFPFG